jgi:aldehyde:ferredoxin oxidoreductase
VSATALKGVLHKVAWADLSNGRIDYEAPSDEVYERYLGGYGLGAYELFRRQPPKTGALAPEALLCFATGPLTGTDAITGNRFTVCAKSPKTGGWGDANCGGTFGPALKRASLDAVFVTGAAEAPVYLLAQGGLVQVRDAGPLWGLGCKDAEGRLRTAHGPRASAAVIGPAGERLSGLACLINDGGRAAARSGLGAVMGSKRLKAVVAVGEGRVEVADPEGLKALRRRYIREHCNDSNPSYASFRSTGTPGSLVPLLEMGDVPVKNWSGTIDDVPGYERMTGGEMIARQTRRYACWSCPIGCGGHVEVRTGPFAGRSHKPEYETMAAFGPLCLNTDMDSLCRVNAICNDAGIDTISAGATVAFALDCYENGLITAADTGGLELRWGDAAAIVELTEQLAYGRGFGGETLGDGMRPAVERLAPEAREFAMECGGEELPMHDPRCFPGAAASYVVDATPARHTQFGSYYAESHFLPADLEYPPMGDRYRYSGKAETHRFLSAYGHVINITGMCQFGAIVLPASAIPEFMTLACGQEFPLERLLEIGERVATLRMAFNAREGVCNERDYRLPRRAVGEPPIVGGPIGGVTVDDGLERREYYEAMGWDIRTGMPTRASLERLGLAFAAEAVEA